MTATALDRSATPVWLRVGEIILAALIYFALARASLYFASLNASATPIWPPTGLAIALLLLRGNMLLPAIAVGAFAANYAITPQISTAAIIAIGNSLEALVATLLLQRWAKGQNVFQSPVGVGKFAVIVTAAAAPVSASIGVVALAMTGHAAWSDFVPVWITWWLGNVAGAILATPALVLWARTLRGEEPAPLVANALASFAGAIFVATIAFSPISPVPLEARSALAFLVILPLLWSALRLGLRETATMALLISSFAVWGVIAGSSPFVQATLNSSLLLLVTFIVSATLPSLALAAERRQSQTLLDQTRHELVQAQKLEALGTLTSGVAHDFNNLLAAIGGGLRILERQNEERTKTMEAVAQALERGSGLTRQLLAFARREPLKLERLDTTQALESAHSLIRSSLKDHILFEMHVTPGLWPVKADRNQFEVALLNLAVNARDAMPEGGDLIIQAENILGDDQEKCVAISVADSGEGMSQETLARAFEPFFSTKAAGHGTGLGLAQVYGFATQCGGKVNIDSALGHGTTVTITLPRA
ncbi:MAG: MASE1 domain-containing protein [Hyphomonadaceae bacterium]|nr:MASE1 domain-containing protein [Hyphomonadaceae bacterium]